MDDVLALLAGLAPVFLIAWLLLLVIGFLLKGERFTMRQMETGKTVEVKRGFSFTYFFFGPFVPLLRGHISGFFLTLLIELVSCTLGHWVLLFCYNGMYIDWLVKNGYRRLEPETGGAFPPAGENAVPPEEEFRRPPAGQDSFRQMTEVLTPDNAPAPQTEDDDLETRALAKGGVKALGGEYQGAEIPLKEGEKILIGRDAERSSLIIDDRSVSRRHVEILYSGRGQGYQVWNHSVNGVFLKDGTLLPRDAAVSLPAGTMLRLGNTENIFLLL